MVDEGSVVHDGLVEQGLVEQGLVEQGLVVALALATGRWVKSSRSTGNCACVEIHGCGDHGLVLIRDSKFRRNPANAGSSEPVVGVTSTAFTAFLHDVERGDGVWLNGMLVVEELSDGDVVLRSGCEPTVLRYTSDEWVAFRGAVVAHEFDIARL